MAVKFGSILEPNNPNTTAIAKTVHLSGARSVPTYADLNKIIPTVLSPSFDPATGTIDTKDAIGQVWYVASENKYYRLSNIRITGDKPPFTAVTSWENFATSIVSSQEQWLHDYIASGVSTQTVLGYDPQSGSSTANNIYFTDANRITFLTGGKYFKLDSSNGSEDVGNPALIVTESTLNKQVSNIYNNDIDPLWNAATALNNNVEVLYTAVSSVNTDLQNTKSTVNNIITYINGDLADYIKDLYDKVGTATANATWSKIIADTTSHDGTLPKGTVKAIVGDTGDYIVQFGTNQTDLQNVIKDDNNNELSRANILVGKNVVTKKQQALVYTQSRDVSTNKIVSMDELTINPNSIYLGNRDTTAFTNRDNLTITPGVISMYAGTNMDIQLGTKSENHKINIIPDSTNALYGATFTNLPLNVESLNFKNGTTLTSFNTAVNDIIDTKVYTRNININNKSQILTTIDPGELVVWHATSSNGFIVRTKPPASGNIYQLQLLATNSRQSYQYNFPLTGGTVALESYVDTAITNLSTNFTNIVGDLQEQITDNYNGLDDKITAVNTRVDTTNTNLETTNTNLATTNTNLTNHAAKYATTTELGHVMLGTKNVISNNFVVIGKHTNGGLVFSIDAALNANSGQPLKNSVITAELAKKATTEALTTGLATKVDKDMTSVTGREMIVSLANGTDTMSGLGVHDGNVMAIGNGIGDAVVANGLGVDVTTGISYLYSSNDEYNLTELVKTTIPGIQTTLATKADATTVNTALAKKADKATTLAGYGITDAYTKTATDSALSKKADKATTLAGYGITDAYTKTATDSALAKKADSTTVTTELAKKADKATTLAGYGITDTYTKTELDGKLVGAMRFKGNVDTYDDLPSTGQVHGDMWNVLDTGDNYAWNSDTSSWDNLSGVVNLADYAKTADVNSAISTAVSNHNSSSSAHSTLFAAKANKATTLAGYGITDAYTKTATDTALAKKADKATTLAGYGITDAYTSDEVDTELAKKADSVTVTTELAKKANTATTLVGYGITDAYTKTAVDTALAKKADSTTVTTELAKKADKATTLAGYGITDAYTKTATDTALAKKADKATTLAGYGITDAYTSDEVDTELAKKATTEALTTGLATKADKATTLTGYGITDAYTKTAVDTALAKKANSATTLSGYGITDAYTKTATDTALAKKADKATTLAGYGITDTYTKTELDGKLVGAMRFKGNVDTYADLPSTGQVHGDMWNVLDTGDNYAWNSDTSSWDNLSGIVNLADYAKTTDVNSAISTAVSTHNSSTTAHSTLFAAKANKATTLSGYGITDAYTKTATDTALAKKVDTTTLTTELAKKANTATTLSGYGITDAYTKTAIDTALAKKANTATTLSGYGITDAYTSDEVDTELAKKATTEALTTGLATKADKATTLSGYGITDAYTKTAVDTALAKKATTDALTTGLATKIDKNTTSITAKGTVLSINSVATIGNNAKNYTAFGRGITSDTQSAGIAVNSTNNVYLYENSTEYALADILSDINTAKTTSATNTTDIAALTTTVNGHTTSIASLTTTANNALSKTVTTQQTVASSVKVNNTLYATTIYENNTSLATKYAAKSHTHAIGDVTNLQTTLDGKASTTAVETLTGNLATEVSDRKAADTNLQSSITANATNITTLQNKVAAVETGLNNALSKTVTTQQTVAGSVKFSSSIYATTIYENNTSLADTYAKKADVYTKTETDSVVVAVISNKNKSVWSPEFTTTDYDSTENAYKWIIGVYTIPAYSNELPIVHVYEDSSATGTAKTAGATKLELVQPKIVVTYDSTGANAAVTAYFNFESADLPIVAYRYKAQVWFPGMSVTTESGGQTPDQ